MAKVQGARMSAYLCDRCGAELVTSGRHRGLAEVFRDRPRGGEIPWEHRACTYCGRIENCSLYLDAPLVEMTVDLTGRATMLRYAPTTRPEDWGDGRLTDGGIQAAEDIKTRSFNAWHESLLSYRPGPRPFENPTERRRLVELLYRNGHVVRL